MQGCLENIKTAILQNIGIADNFSGALKAVNLTVNCNGKGLGNIKSLIFNMASFLQNQKP